MYNCIAFTLVVPDDMTRSAPKPSGVMCFDAYRFVQKIPRGVLGKRGDLFLLFLKTNSAGGTQIFTRVEINTGGGGAKTITGVSCYILHCVYLSQVLCLAHLKD